MAAVGYKLKLNQMKYSIVVILFLAPLIKKCSQEGAEQGVKIGREALENGSKTIVHNADAIVARVAAKSTQYFARYFNKENQNVSYIDSTNTFEINNERLK